MPRPCSCAGGPIAPAPSSASAFARLPPGGSSASSVELRSDCAANTPACPAARFSARSRRASACCERWQSAHVARSVSVTPDGAVVFAATDGALVALGGEAGEEFATIEVDDPVAVRIDPAGGVVLAASRGGLLHAFACR